MKRGFYFAAACLVACCVVSMAKAEEEHRREGGGGFSKTWVGTFVKTDGGKLALKHNNESHLVVAGEKATDEVKAKLADAEKELIGQGTFEVSGVIKKEGDVVTIHANSIKKGEVAGGGGEHKERK